MPPVPSCTALADRGHRCDLGRSALGTYLLFRIIGKPEEGRYQQLRVEWGGNAGPKFLRTPYVIRATAD